MLAWGGGCPRILAGEARRAPRPASGSGWVVGAPPPRTGPGQGVEARPAPLQRRGRRGRGGPGLGSTGRSRSARAHGPFPGPHPSWAIAAAAPPPSQPEAPAGPPTQVRGGGVTPCPGKAGRSPGRLSLPGPARPAPVRGGGVAKGTPPPGAAGERPARAPSRAACRSGRSHDRKGPGGGATPWRWDEVLGGASTRPSRRSPPRGAQPKLVPCPPLRERRWRALDARRKGGGRRPAGLQPSPRPAGGPSAEARGSRGRVWRPSLCLPTQK